MTEGILKRFETAEMCFTSPPVSRDSWVIGDEPYVSLHFLGADHYTR